MQRLVLAVDAGGTNLRLGAVTESGELLRAARYPMCPARMEDFAAELFVHIDEMLGGRSDGEQFLGIGIGVKGIVDARRQMLTSSSILRECSSYDLCKELRQRYGLSAAMDNDAHAAAIAELKFGVGRTCDDFIYVNVGTGTAVGIVSEGRLVRGYANAAGELGSCVCERPGEPGLYKLESVASGQGLDEETRRLAPRHPNSELLEKLSSGERVLSAEIFDACRKSDALAAEVAENALRTLSLAVLNMAILLNPGLFVFGGGVVTDKWFMERLERKVKILCEKTGAAWTAGFKVSGLGAGDVGTLGAASVLLEALERGTIL